MQNIKIRQHESGTIIPNCGLDKPTDALRRCFQMSLDEFYHSFQHPASPGKLLYYLLSSQLHLNARVTTLFDHINSSRQKLYKTELRIREDLESRKDILTETMKSNEKAKLERIALLRQSFDSVSTRLEVPQEQLVKFKEIRTNKIEKFHTQYQALRTQLADALSVGGITQIKPLTLDKILAFVFELARESDMTTDKLVEERVNPKIKEAITPITPSDLLDRVLSILFSPNFWALLSCNPNLPVAVEITPVIINILREFDKFTGEHARLIEGIDKLKNALDAIEKHYTDSLLSSQIREMVDASIYEVYKKPEKAVAAAPRETAGAQKKRRFRR